MYCKNWRPITLLSCVGKIFERILSQRLLYYCKINKLITPNQAGFQQNLKTYDLLLRYTEAAYEAIRNNSVLYSIFLDITAAYDSIWHNGLLYKLRHVLGITGRMYWIIVSFLQHRYGRVVINGNKSQWKEFKIGVPQGSCLSPLLFILFINDISKFIARNVDCGQFADDIALWTSSYDNIIKNMENMQQQLQESINIINSWCIKWKLQLSPSKTQYLIVKSPKKKKYANINIEIDGFKVIPTNKARYLGIIFDENLTWKYHINQIYKKASKKLGYLTQICKGYNGPNLHIYLLLYKMTVRSCMEYGSAIWNDANMELKQLLDSIQFKALKRGLLAFASDSLIKLQMITNIEDLESRRQIEGIKLLNESRIKYQTDKTHNLAKAYDTYINSKPTNSKISPMKQANINEIYNNIPPIEVKNKQETEITTPYNTTTIPQPTNSPWSIYYRPTIDLILASLTGNEIIIWIDGSCIPNPGFGGSAAFIQLLNKNKILQYKHINIVNNIEAEIKALDIVIKDLISNENDYIGANRIIILCDCKYVVDAVKGINSKNRYKSKINKIQQNITKLNHIPELYWIKGHAGTPGNEKADKLAKEIAKQRQDEEYANNQQNNEIIDNKIKLAASQNVKSLLTYVKHQYNVKWNKEWIDNKNNKSKEYKYTCNIIKSNKHNMNAIFNKLSRLSIMKITRLITGHNNLNGYMNKIGLSKTNKCPHCPNKKETVVHLFLECQKYNQHRKVLFNGIKSITGIRKSNKIHIKLLLTGIYKNKKYSINQRLNIINQTIKYINNIKRKI